MKNPITTLFITLVSLFSFGQKMDKPSENVISSLPEWAQLMYSATPNVYEVDAAYQAYFGVQIFEKSYHTQYYKQWRRMVDPYVQANGFYVLPTDAELLAKRSELLNTVQPTAESGNWTLFGPIVTYNGNGDRVSQQANVYSIDQSASNPSILYAGTEPGEVYKSTDAGTTWQNVSLNDPLSGGVYAVEIHPTNPNYVIIGTGGTLFKTTDGGITWANVLTNVGRANEILYNPSNPLIVLAATANGLFRSTDGGNTWATIYTDDAHDVKLNTANNMIVYLLKKNTGQSRCEFFISTDMGVTFTQQTNGWYMSTDPARYDGGARLAVSEADPNRIYAYLIGEAKPGDTGFIGVYRSNDGGVTWTLPNGPDGGPYTTTHMNLAIGSPTWQYHQGYYNCALMASNANPDELLLGGLNLYKSDDGGATFYPLAGYVGGTYPMHVDMQDFRQYGTTSWITTDGGIYRSSDFFNTDGFESRMYGIHSSDYWGFGQGWNEDVTIGGQYHNGNISSYENWGTEDFLQLGGGEPASGYVNPGQSKRVYSSDINGKILPENIGDPISSVGFGIDPNESYFVLESSELEFDPRCYSKAYTGKDHELWYTDDMGINFYVLNSFGVDSNDRVTQIEIAWSNPDVMYVCQFVSSNNGKLWKTMDAGASWNEIALPTTVGNKRKMLIQVNPEDENDVWIAFGSGANNNKIFRSMNGGSSWTNMTTSSINNQSARWIAYIGGSNGGIYYATNQTIYYRNNSMSAWEDFGDGLPVVMPSNIARPFYRDGKIRIGSYGKGIWESPLFEAQDRPVAQISVDKLKATVHCEVDTFRYVDHSMLNHAGATWQWTFQGGTPASASTWKEDVVYSSPGTYLTVLTVTDAGGQSSTDSLYITVEAYIPSPILSEDFESGFPPANWEIKNADQAQTWELSTAAGGFGNSTNSMVLRGFDYWPGGDEDDIRVSVDMTVLESAELTFDVAYAQYAANYSDSLEILVSTDCGATYSSLYFKGGIDLATAPNQSTFFTPAANEWRKDTINLAAYEGVSDVLIVFRSHTGWGNNVYVDNVNLTGIDHTGITEVALLDMNVFPTLVESGGQLHLASNLNEEIDFAIYSSGGKQVFRQKMATTGTIDLGNWECGTYLFVARSSKHIKRGKFVIY